MTSTTEQGAPTEQPDTTYARLPGESANHYKARRDAIRTARAYDRGWFDAVEALLDVARSVPETHAKAIGAALGKLDRIAAVDAFRAREYEWNKQFAAQLDALAAAESTQDGAR